MKKTNYEQEDIFPVVISTLHICAESFEHLMYRAALEGPYADLKPLLKSEEIDKTAVQLIAALDDPLSLLVKSCIADLIICANKLSKKHKYKYRKPRPYNYDPMTQKAYFFYREISFYNDGIGRNTKGGRGDLHVYTFCVDHLIFHLARLVIRGFLQVRRHWASNYLEMEKVNFDLFDDYDQPEVRLLVELGRKLDVHCDGIVALVGKRKWRRKSSR